MSDSADTLECPRCAGDGYNMDPSYGPVPCRVCWFEGRVRPLDFVELKSLRNCAYSIDGPPAAQLIPRLLSEVLIRRAMHERSEATIFSLRECIHALESAIVFSVKKEPRE